MKEPISWSSRTAYPSLTIKRSWKLLSAVALGISSVHTWRGVCIIDTVAIELLFVSNCYCNDATRDCHWATCKIPASQHNRQVRDVALAASGMDTFPLHAVFSTHSLVNTANSHVDCSVQCEQSLLLHRHLH